MTIESANENSVWVGQASTSDWGGLGGHCWGHRPPQPRRSSRPPPSSGRRMPSPRRMPQRFERARAQGRGRRGQWG